LRCSPCSASDWRGRMRRTFLRCSLRRQQPSLGSRRFDDLCDAFLYARMFAGQVRAGGLATFTAAGLRGESLQRGKVDYACASVVCGACPSARKVGVKLWSVLLLQAAFASVNMRGDWGGDFVRPPGPWSIGGIGPDHESLCPGAPCRLRRADQGVGRFPPFSGRLLTGHTGTRACELNKASSGK
jgi:hypothetical protein